MNLRVIFMMTFGDSTTASSNSEGSISPSMARSKSFTMVRLDKSYWQFKARPKSELQVELHIEVFDSESVRGYRAVCAYTTLWNAVRTSMNLEVQQVCTAQNYYLKSHVCT